MVSNYIKQDSLSIDGFRSICITIVFNDDDDDDGHADDDGDGHADDDGDNDGLVFPIGWPGGNIASLHQSWPLILMLGKKTFKLSSPSLSSWFSSSRFSFGSFLVLVNIFLEQPVV